MQALSASWVTWMLHICPDASAGDAKRHPHRRAPLRNRLPRIQRVRSRSLGRACLRQPIPRISALTPSPPYPQAVARPRLRTFATPRPMPRPPPLPSPPPARHRRPTHPSGRKGLRGGSRGRGVRRAGPCATHRESMTIPVREQQRQRAHQRWLGRTTATAGQAASDRWPGERRRPHCCQQRARPPRHRPQPSRRPLRATVGRSRGGVPAEAKRRCVGGRSTSRHRLPRAFHP
mmetsp:Transcript_45913/g.147523  ORF Transcript_45913/g.147523 Transcript_45913/m.147523 type:complete len:233 (-) Transcript_45913:42-740(-)